MSYADKVFKAMCRDIIDNGEDTKGELVRPTWPDTGEKAYTIKKFGVCNRYDLRKEFPAITIRKTFIKTAFKELLWIWQKKSNNVNDLDAHIWDEWADENGSIGKAYGYQIGKKYLHHYHKKNEVFKDNEYPSMELRSEEGIHEAVTPFDDVNHPAVYLDQIDAVLWDLKHNPYSRRIMTNIYDLQDLHEMNLYPWCS